MRCGKCGAELSDDAVFCDQCGEFVMRGQEGESLDVSEGDGRRRRNHSAFWLIFRISAWIVIVAAGISAIVIGYRVISDPSERLKRMYSPNASVWDIMRLQEPFNPLKDIGVQYNPDSGKGEH